MGNSWQAPPTQDEAIAGRIFKEMGEESFLRALFGGDGSASVATTGQQLPRTDGLPGNGAETRRDDG
jgi:hypothetical protein